MANDQAFGGGRGPQPAARVGDEIAHGFGLAGMIAGAVAGALIGAAVLAATAATGGLAIAIMGGAIAGGGLSTLQIVKGLGAVFNWPEPTTGKLIRGSPDVFINGRPAVRAGDDTASSCTGLALNHPLWPFQVTVAEGSATVFINGKPAGRVGSKLVCGAHIKTGSGNVFIGGATVSVAFVLDIEGWMKTGLEILGLAAVGAAAVLAAMVGATALAGLVVAGAVAMGGMALLGDLGDRLGPGYRDLLQGVAGIVLLGAGPKMARLGGAGELPVAKFKPGFTESDILAMPKGKRPLPETYLEKAYIDKHRESFEGGGSFIFTADDIANPKYPGFNPNKFVMKKSDLAGKVTEFQKTGDVSVLESALGYDPGALAGKEIYVLHLEKPTVLMPSGNEGGANSLWRPAGYTYPAGMREAVLDNVSIQHGNDSIC
jgi:uncharacterized Zn-binding protein involved in type VI secretion